MNNKRRGFFFFFLICRYIRSGIPPCLLIIYTMGHGLYKRRARRPQAAFGFWLLTDWRLTDWLTIGQPNQPSNHRPIVCRRSLGLAQVTDYWKWLTELTLKSLCSRAWAVNFLDEAESTNFVSPLELDNTLPRVSAGASESIVTLTASGANAQDA